ncbi:hypothetical protein [Mycobacteroides abscessus]|uniref:hypothetical protein n=1 Tax=Mycobacteroides abscessus TaxID=36809 RepID=UPI0009A70B79|nr:hypothetical protein [Mycobacteroides abscessus]SKH87992.1 Uncharacterised protein [Mycobacteroides abscessus subsp. massiliense]SKH92036.1 Uncharacterised protein [Mycobacteroides abscessus subsp. massiliense]SKI12600.1 Uncharacterised protein [Mycobacteroides abscessus subsp. massiliense]SKK21642.1 Uncharacterised protein [Mycobacteroides abscessus subsp. massiliense]SKK31635.1 Uncharacterised protein [Mycobacteroides abscessus subsp. massiliense]
MAGTAHNLIHTVYLWPLALSAATMGLAGYFHSRALKLIDHDGPSEFITNWQGRTELTAIIGFGWFVASIAGLFGSSIAGFGIIGMLLTAFAPLVMRAVTRSYDEHREVQRKSARVNH